MAHQGHQVQKPIYEQSLKAKDKLCKLLFKSNIFEKQRQTLPITFQTKYLWKAKTNYANYFSKAISLKSKDKLCKLLVKKIFGKQRQTMQITFEKISLESKDKLCK